MFTTETTETTAETSSLPRVSVVPVPFSYILDAPNFDSLLQAYAGECSVPDASPQRLIYEALEQAGSLRCFAAYSTVDTPAPFLVGFVSVLVGPVPHHGHRLATVESIFAEPSYRDTGVGNLLLDAAEQYATEIGCPSLIYVVRIGSRLDKVLSRRAGCKLTHAQYTKQLQAPGGQE